MFSFRNLLVLASAASALLPTALSSVEPNVAKPTAQATPMTTAGAQSRLASSSETYIENKGQWDGRAQYLAQSGNLDVWITQEGAVYDYHKFVPEKKPKPEPMRFRHEPLKGTRVGQVVRMSFVGAKPTAITGSGEQEGKYNYFIGKIRATGVRRFSEVKAEQIYDGIATRWYFEGGHPRYDVVVAPGADPNQVRMKIDGADAVTQLPNGNVRIDTSLGPIEERGLSVYQEGTLGRTSVDSSILVDGDVVRFRVGDYDRTKRLVIDPLIYSTYLGGSNADYVSGLAMSSQGQAVVVGHTGSSNFPVSVGAYQSSVSGGVDGFVSRLSADGSKLVFSTYVGGLYDDYCDAVALDGSGNIVVAGHTDSTDFPVTAGAYQTKNKANLNGFSQFAFNAFITKLSADGSSVLRSTFLGGSSVTTVYGGYCEFTAGIAVDPSGNVVIAGETWSKDFPTTAGAYQKRNNAAANGASNGFISKLSANLNSLISSTYLGGSGESQGFWGDDPRSIVLDAAGHVILVGDTPSLDFPTTPNAYEPRRKGTSDTVFVSKLAGDFSSLLDSTYLDSSRGGGPLAVALNESANVVVVGFTYSADFPVTLGSYQSENKAAANDAPNAFISKLSLNLSSLIYSTYLGGSGSGAYEGDAALAVAVDASGGIVVGGYTYSENFPVTVGAYQTTLQVGSAFVSKLSSNGGSLIYSTYIGGGFPQIGGVCLDGSGNALVAGSIGASELQTTAGAYQATFGGGLSDGFVTKLTLPTMQSIMLNSSSVVGGNSITGNVTLATFTGANASIVFKFRDANARLHAPVTIASGHLSAPFIIDTSVVTSVDNETVSASYGGVTKTASFAIGPFGVTQLVHQYLSVVGGNPDNAVATISRVAPAGGTALTISSSDPSAVNLPPTVTVPAGKTTAAFLIPTVPVTVDKAVSISASWGGLARSVTLTVQAPRLAGIAFGASTVNGGSGVLTTFTLNGKAPVGGVVVGLSSTPPGLLLHANSVTVPAGSRSVPVVIVAASPYATTEVTLAGTRLGLSKTATIKVKGVTTGNLFPLDKGRTWTYNYTLAPGGSGVATLTSLGPVTFKGGSAVELSYGNGNNYWYKAAPPGVAEAGEEHDAEKYPVEEFVPAWTIIPGTTVPGFTWQQGLTLTGLNPGGTVGYVDQDTASGKVVGVETVTVPAGTFHNALHIRVSRQTVGSSQADVFDYWFVPGIGLVQEFDVEPGISRLGFLKSYTL